MNAGERWMQLVYKNKFKKDGKTKLGYDNSIQIRINVKNEAK